MFGFPVVFFEQEVIARENNGEEGWVTIAERLRSVNVFVKSDAQLRQYSDCFVLFCH